MGVLDDVVVDVTNVFRRSADKHEAHREVAPILKQVSHDPRFFSEALQKNLEDPAFLEARNYPTVGLTIASNAYCEMLVNCWIPLPGRETDISTKTIHHHGRILLTTVTLFGPGYEHWLFTPPQPLDRTRDVFTMELVEAAPHPAHHVSFVDAFVPHLPIYPPSLSVTFCVFSSQDPVTWKDHVKRIGVLKRHEEKLRHLAVALGVAGRLDLKVIEYHDYYPTPDGFQGMRERKEYERGPNEDHLQSLFHVLQETGNQALAKVIERQIASGRRFTNHALIEKLLADLHRDVPIEGRLSACHLDVPHSTFRKADVERTLNVLRARKVAHAS
jgi:hypothetical protein